MTTIYQEYYVRHPFINLTENPTLMKDVLPKLIGAKGTRFNWIKQISGINHIWYNDKPYYNQINNLVTDCEWGFIQLWGSPEAIRLAIQYLDYYIFQLVEIDKMDKQKND